MIAERERRLRSSEQHVHAERALRGEVEQALAAKTRATDHDLRVLHEHVADLERELARMRRTVDEAQHLAAAAEAARADAERRLAERPPAPPECGAAAHAPAPVPPALASRAPAPPRRARAAGADRSSAPLGRRPGRAAPDRGRFDRAERRRVARPRPARPGARPAIGGAR